jgi:WD40 repeat protein
LRQTQSPSIISQPDFQISPVDGGEEINCLDFCHLTKDQQTYLATADDDGCIRVYDSVPGKKGGNDSIGANIKPCKTYQHAEDELVLATSVLFRPHSIKSRDVVTAGTDCTICLWDINRPHNKPSSSILVRQDDNENSAQICNPPIVHSLSWSASGRLLSAGLGDGTCLVASVDGRNLVERCRLGGGHNSAVASVLFPNFALTSSDSNMAADDRLMVSAGSDGNILLWDLGSQVAGCDTVDPSTKFVDCSQRSCSDVDEASSSLQGMTLSHQTSQKILFGIPHQEKINFMTSSKNGDYTLFISDTSNDITLYTLPLL